MLSNSKISTSSLSGLHDLIFHFLIFILSHPHVAPFSEVKQRVEDDYMQDKGDQAIMRKYKELEAKYETAFEP